VGRGLQESQVECSFRQLFLFLGVLVLVDLVSELRLQGLSLVRCFVLLLLDHI